MRDRTLLQILTKLHTIITRRMALCVSQNFKQSLTDHASYPLNLWPLRGQNYHVLQRYREQLDIASANLCMEDEKYLNVPIRDLFSEYGKVEKCNIHTLVKLERWLGTDEDPRDKSLGMDGSKNILKHPKCRFVYLYAENSRDQLRLTRSVLTLILSYHQVTPKYLDFMFVFGAQSDPRDLRFTGFCAELFIRETSCKASIPELDRSGRSFQLCYNLKGVTLKNNCPENISLSDWSIRQAAIHHQFDIVSGNTLWIITKGRLDLQQRFKHLTGSDGRPEDKSFGDLYECFRSSLAAHLMYCQWSTEDWRWYIRWLEDVVEAVSAMAVYGPRSPGHAHKQYQPGDIQDLQYWKDKISEAIMVLESNVDVLTSLRKFYLELKSIRDFPSELKVRCEDDIDSFISELDGIMNTFTLQISRAKLLAGIVNDRKELVIQHLQGQAAERTEQLNLHLEKETIGMRVITIVTLLYLPATFVSTFFSTDIVKYQDPDGGGPGPGIFSSTALVRWLQVTLPLTFLTMFSAWFMYRRAAGARHRGTFGFKWTKNIRRAVSEAWYKTSWSLKEKSPALPHYNSSRGPN